ncbi:P-loop containing nucleoside triphosphate hydrolase protein [Mycena maculata]|uniref:DNA 3'-5' helicase n=1 Tax=Mycena maculata TaxID=230809 RepID=A0AAD7JE57_9AGAR|nr:P-loop containing nucleoside triphosphate hydrolase protein [Mycena maculata]
MPREDDHVKRAAESQRILRAAPKKARKKNGYDSEATRHDLARLFEDSFKKPAYEWQLDVSEVFLLGLDVVAITGTGAGKTMPFMMPLLLHRDKYSLGISPLKVLQEDQAKRFEKMGLKAAAVNGDTYPATGKRVLGSIIDEAHCASQWGGDFRPHYALLDKLRVLLPAGSPILATSATLSPAALKDICLSLDLNLDEAFFINLGNDRPNITPSVIKMNSAKDYAAINAHLPKPEDVRSTADLPKGIGADIPDIKLIIQFGVPGSLPIWIQRAGRAGRSPELQARAILLVEKSMFQRKKKRKRKGKAKGEAAADPDSSDSGSSSESEDEGGAAAVPKSAGGFYALDSVEEPNDGKVWVKNVDPILREYITTKLCRRDMADRYFSNPPRRRE